MDSIEKELDGRAPPGLPCPWQALWANRKSCFLNPLIWVSRDSYVIASSISPLISILPLKMASLTFSIDWALLRAVCCQGPASLPVPSAQERAQWNSWALPVGGVCPESRSLLTEFCGELILGCFELLGCLRINLKTPYISAFPKI